MLLPFQCVLICSFRDTEVLLTASGSTIYSFDLKCGSVLSTWPSERCNLTSDVSSPVPQARSPKPSPKRSNSSSNGGAKISPAQSRFEDGYIKSIDSNFVIKLAGSSNSQHIIAITEDKCVHVLSLSSDGALIQLSER